MSKTPRVLRRAADPWWLRLRWRHHRSDIPSCVPKTSRSLWRRRPVVLSVVVSQSWSSGRNLLFADLCRALKKLRDTTLRMNRLGLSWSDKESRFSLTVKQRFRSTNSKPPIPTEEVFKSWMKRSSRKKKKFVVLIKETNDADKINNFFMNSNWSKIWISVKLMRKVSVKWKNWRDFKVQHSTTIARRKLVEDRDTVLELTGKIQELQNEINCMNDSRDFQDAESARSGHSHVTSQPVFFPPHPVPGGMLSRSIGMPSRREGPPSIWDTRGISGNVFANPAASSSAPYPQESNPWISNVSEQTSPRVMSESQTPVQDQRCQSGPSAKSSVIPSEGDSSKNYGADQQRLQIEDLHFDKFTTPATFASWKIRFKTEVCTCSQFPTQAMLWIKEVEIVDSVDDLRSSLSVIGIRMPDFEVLDAKIAAALNRIIHNSHFKRRISLEEQKAQKQDRFLRGRQIAYLIYEYFRVTGAYDSVENYADLFILLFEMMIFRNSIRNGTEFYNQWRKSQRRIAFSVTMLISVQKWHSRIRLRVLSCNRMREMRREPEVPEERVPVGESFDCHARITSKELTPIHSVKSGTLQNACSTRTRVVADWEKSARMHIARLMNSLAKGLKWMVTKVQWTCWKGMSSVKEQGDLFLDAYSSNTRQLGCVFPRHGAAEVFIDFTEELRHAETNPTCKIHKSCCTSRIHSGMICPGDPYQRNPNAPKLEDRSREETEWQERCAREAAWRLAKSVLKVKEKIKAAFFSLSENRCLPASTLKPEEREFVVDSGASMRMISKKDLNDAEMDTLTKSCSPTTVITAHGEVQTHEEATVYVKELDMFLTMKVLEDTPAVLSLGKLCDENGYSYEWITGQKPHLIKTGFGHNVTRRTSFRSWFQAFQRVLHPVLHPVLILQPQWQLLDRKMIILHLPQARLLLQLRQHQATGRPREREDLSGIDSHPVPVSSPNVEEMIERGNPLFATDSGMQPQANPNPKTNREETTMERGNPLFADSGRAPLSSEILEWLQEFRENLVDERVPEHRDSHASSSHEVLLEPTFKRREDFCKHSVLYSFP